MTEPSELEKHGKALETCDLLSDFIDFLYDKGIEFDSTPEDLLREFYGIDPEKLEAERRALLEKVREGGTT